MQDSISIGPLGFYECNRMPFGLTIGLVTFKRLMARCMGYINLQDCLIYLDGIVVFSSTFDEHIQCLDAVFSRLSKHKVKLKGKKCEFFRCKVTHIGHVVSEDGIHANPGNINVGKLWPTTKTTKHVHKSLGFTGYYR